MGAIGSLRTTGAGSVDPATGGEVTTADPGIAMDASPAAPAAAPADPTFATSFDCDDANSETKKLICRDEELAQADIRMAQAYRAALAKAPDPDALRRRQRAWLVKRDESGQDREAVGRVYAARIEELERPALEEPIF